MRLEDSPGAQTPRALRLPGRSSAGSRGHDDQTPPFSRGECLGWQCMSQDQSGPLLPPATPWSRGAERPPGEAAPEVPACSVRPEAPVASFEVCYRGVSLWQPHSDLERASRVPVPCLMGTRLIHWGLPWLSSPQSDGHRSVSATEKRR